MIYINITNFVLMSYLEKDLSMIETRRLKDVVILFKRYSHFFHIYASSGTRMHAS